MLFGRYCKGYFKSQYFKASQIEAKITGTLRRRTSTITIFRLPEESAVTTFVFS